jgi:hypothetical protein
MKMSSTNNANSAPETNNQNTDEERPSPRTFSLIPDAFKKITLRAAAAEYLESAPVRMKPPKRQREEGILNRHILPRYGERSLASLWEADFQNEITHTLTTKSAHALLLEIMAYQFRKEHGRSRLPKARPEPPKIPPPRMTLDEQAVLETLLQRQLTRS